MKVEDAITRIRQETHDISKEYSDERCLQFLNTATQQVASLLIGAKWPVLVEETTMREGDSIPKNYMSACGTYPLAMTAGTVHITDPDITAVKFRYFATPPIIDSATKELPFNHDAINDIIVKSAVLLALNENEYDISQDTNIVNALQQAISTGMS
jgi:hypothetical protein